MYRSRAAVGCLATAVYAATSQSLASRSSARALVSPLHTFANTARAKSSSSSAEPVSVAAAAKMTDEEIFKAVESGKIKFFDLENALGDFERAVRVRRHIVDDQIAHYVKTKATLDALPYKGYDYAKIHGQCAENVVGYVPIPVGVAGPLKVDGTVYQVPMATTEGALIASTTRGCKAITLSGGATTAVTRDGMTRAPVLRVAGVHDARRLVEYVKRNYDAVRTDFESTSRFAKLLDVQAYHAGRLVFLRFKAFSGDAMGMNMCGKAVEKALSELSKVSPVEFEVLALSGNVCTDKKVAAINWIEGRGKSVSADAIIKGDVVRGMLKTSVKSMVYLNYAKNLVGSSVAGSIGGNNAHAANMVAAIFLATGQDPAQVVESANCLVTMEEANDGQDLYVSVNMPSLEVGTIGGGTALPAQNSCLRMLGTAGSKDGQPGENAKRLASVIASTVMAGELSLCAALSSGHLISSHMKLNRKPSPK